VLFYYFNIFTTAMQLIFQFNVMKSIDFHNLNLSTIINACYYFACIFHIKETALFQ